LEGDFGGGVEVEGEGNFGGEGKVEGEELLFCDITSLK